MSALTEESIDSKSSRYRPVFEKLFKKTGKQGIVGICRLNGKRKVFKVSRYINYTAVHEYNIMKSLERLDDFCPFFSKATDLIETNLSPKFRDQSNPLALGSGHKFKSHILYAELIKGKSLSSLIKKKDLDVRIILSTMKQTLAAINIAQKEEKLTHYDLHSSNILVTPCHENSIALFITQDSVIQTPTYGAKPVIIDFGFSYSNACRKKKLTSSLAHTEIGFLSHMHDPIADPKLLLITLAYEAKLYHSKNKHMSLFRKIVKDMFKCLPTDPTSGWDKDYREISAIDTVMEITDSQEPKSKIFNRYNHFALDIMQHMIKLPLKRKSYKELELAFASIDEEMHKLSKEIGSEFFNLYMFRKITEFASSLREAFISEQKLKGGRRSVKLFKKKIYTELDKISKYCMPKLNFEKLLCSLLVYSDSIEGILYQECKSLWKTKQKDYEKLKYKTIPEILDRIDKFLPDAYEADADTQIIVYDAVNYKTFSFDLADQYKNYNSLPIDKRGKFLQTLYTQISVPEFESSEEENFAVSSEEDDDLGMNELTKPVVVWSNRAKRTFVTQEKITKDIEESLAEDNEKLLKEDEIVDQKQENNEESEDGEEEEKSEDGGEDEGGEEESDGGEEAEESGDGGEDEEEKSGEEESDGGEEESGDGGEEAEESEENEEEVSGENEEEESGDGEEEESGEDEEEESGDGEEEEESGDGEEDESGEDEEEESGEDEEEESGDGGEESGEEDDSNEEDQDDTDDDEESNEEDIEEAGSDGEISSDEEVSGDDE